MTTNMIMILTMGLQLVLTPMASGFVFFPSITMPNISGGHASASSSFQQPQELQQSSIPLSPSEWATSSSLVTTKSLPLFDKNENYHSDHHHSSSSAGLWQQSRVVVVAPRRSRTESAVQKQFCHGGLSSLSLTARIVRTILSHAIGWLVFGLGAFVMQGMREDLEHKKNKPLPPYVAALVGVVLLVGVGIFPSSKRHL